MTETGLGLRRFEQEHEHRDIGVGVMVPEHGLDFPADDLLDHRAELRRRHLPHPSAQELDRVVLAAGDKRPFHVGLCAAQDQQREVVLDHRLSLGRTTPEPVAVALHDRCSESPGDRAEWCCGGPIHHYGGKPITRTTRSPRERVPQAADVTSSRETSGYVYPETVEVTVPSDSLGAMARKPPGSGLRKNGLATPPPASFGADVLPVHLLTNPILVLQRKGNPEPR